MKFKLPSLNFSFIRRFIQALKNGFEFFFPMETYFYLILLVYFSIFILFIPLLIIEVYGAQFNLYVRTISIGVGSVWCICMLIGRAVTTLVVNITVENDKLAKAMYALLESQKEISKTMEKIGLAQADAIIEVFKKVNSTEQIVQVIKEELNEQN